MRLLIILISNRLNQPIRLDWVNNSHPVNYLPVSSFLTLLYPLVFLVVLLHFFFLSKKKEIFIIIGYVGMVIAILLQCN
jgi:hypothetical protein